MRPLSRISYRPSRISWTTLLKRRFPKPIEHLDILSDILKGKLKDIHAKNELISIERSTDQTLASSICIFASYSARSVVSKMILAQLEAYKKAGFSVVFVSMSESISEADMLRLKSLCCVVIQRKSFGRDFGAWAHAIELLQGEMSNVECLLLTNDSNIGPIYPLDSWLKACREQNGFFGLTESMQGGSHLQSYFLVANGGHAVVSAMDFLTTEMKPSHSKWSMIRRGEFGITEYMLKKGHLVSAVLDYETMENAVLDHSIFWTELAVMFPHIFDGLQDTPTSGEDRKAYAHEYNRYLLRSRLFQLPLNPSHHLSSVLIRHFKFPFIKVELVTKNPAKAPSAPDWRYYLTDSSLVSESMVDEHLSGVQIK